MAVTEFMLGTCLGLRHQLNVDNTGAWHYAAAIMDSRSTVDQGDEIAHIPLLTGSVAEFYIQPILSCVGDLDIMFHRSDQLAIPAGTAPPPRLPAEFHSRVKVYNIIDSGFPGYVYLRPSHLLTECSDDGNYRAEQCPGRYIGLHSDSHTQLHGPAFVGTGIQPKLPFSGRVSASPNTVDMVYCIRCLSWPSQAADWKIRHRNYDWPDSAIVDHVISNGCDVVHVAHPRCRQDEWNSQHQWRLSFSRAEIVLLNRWMPAQQVVYHMLRYYVKTQCLTTDSADKIFSNYHVKTLMLWACELKPRSWWTGDLNVVRSSVQLLHTLAVWLTDACYQHYFINSCNLMDHVNDWSSESIQLIEKNLLLVTDAWLADWFIDRYIQNCARLCSSSVSQLFDNVRTSADLVNVVSRLVDDRSIMLPMQSCLCYADAELDITSLVSSRCLTVKQCLFWMAEIRKLDQDLSDYFVALAFLQAAYRVKRTSLEDEVLDVLTTTCLQSNDLRRCRNARHSSVLSLHQAAMLMKDVANNSRSTVQLIEVELSKAYLHRALRCKDSDSDSLYCLANVYLAVLYYTRGQYQSAVDHCTVVTRSRDHSQCSSHVIQGELLPKIDYEIDNVLGLTVFYQYVKTAGLSQQQRTQHVSVFTT